MARPPTGTRQKRFTAAGLPIPRVPLGATNPEQRGAAARNSQLAAQRSSSQRRPAKAPSSSRSPQRRPEHHPDRAATVKEVDRPGLPHQRVLSADQQGRTPSRVNHLHNHRLTSTGRTPSPVLRQPLQQPPPGPVRWAGRGKKGKHNTRYRPEPPRTGRERRAHTDGTLHPPRQ